MQYKSNKNRLLSASALAISLLMTASASATVIECNDCSDKQHLNAIKSHPAGNVFVVDFVHRTVNKYHISEHGTPTKLKSTQAEVININQQFYYRKTQLRDPVR